MLDRFHRDRDGEIFRKHGDTRVRSLRRKFGRNFARGEDGDAKVRDVIERLDELSLRQLIMHR